MSAQQYYQGDQNQYPPHQQGAGYPPQGGYNQGNYQQGGYQPPRPAYTGNPPQDGQTNTQPVNTKKQRGGLMGCLATLCFCFVCCEGCEECCECCFECC